MEVHLHWHRDAAPEWFVQMKARVEDRKRQAAAGLAQAEAMLSEIKSLKKQAQKAGASVYPGWDSGAEEFAKRAKGSWGLAQNYAEDKNKFDEWVQHAKNLENTVRDRKQSLERTLQDARSRGRDSRTADPLQSGSSRAAVGHNIETEERAGKPRKQAIAIALEKAGKSNKDNVLSQFLEEEAREPEHADIAAGLESEAEMLQARDDTSIMGRGPALSSATTGGDLCTEDCPIFEEAWYT